MKFAFTIIVVIYTGIKMYVPVYASPILTIQEKTTKQSSIKISITATAFNGIRSGDLMILYDPSVATAKKVTKSHMLSGTFHSNLVKPGVVVLGWYNYPSLTLPDDTCLFEIEFERVKHGISTITFEVSDDYNCQFYDSNLKKLNDEPAEYYYRPGTLIFEPDSPLPLLKVESIIHPASCNGTGLITLKCSNLKDGLYTVTYDGGTFEKINFRLGTAQIDAPVGIYNNLHITLNNQATPMGVHAIVLVSEPMYAEVGLMVDKQVVCEGSYVTFTALPVNEGSNPIYYWYVNNIKVDGIYSRSYTYQPEDNDEIFVQLISSEACMSDDPATSEIRFIHVIDQVSIEIKTTIKDTIIHAGTQVTINAFISNASTTAEYIWYLNNEPVCKTYDPTFKFIPLDGDEIYAVYNADNPCITEDNSRSNLITFKVKAITSEEAISGIPTGTDLICYPNPFSQNTSLYYSIPQDGIIDIVLTGMNGSKTRLVTNKSQQAGSQFLELDCRTLSAGYYILKLSYYSERNIQFQKKITVIKR